MRVLLEGSKENRMKKETPAEQRARVISERVNNPQVVSNYVKTVFPKKDLNINLMESVITLVQHDQGITHG